MIKAAGLPILAGIVIAGTAAQAQRPVATRDILLPSGRAITFGDFAGVRAVSDPQISPDGSRVLYALRTTDLPRNRRTTVTYMVTVDGRDRRQFPDDTTLVSEARWSPDGKWVAYIRAGQLWLADANGAGRRQLTKLHGGASGPVWSPTGDKLAFTSSVYPMCATDACNAERAKADEANPVKARVTDRLMYRHWNAWQDSTRAHLFVVPVSGGEAKDVTAGVWYDVPPGPFGGSEGYAFAPDGRELAFTAKDQGREAAWSTDINIHTVSADGGAPAVITAANRGADVNPVYSPDGRKILYASQERAGFESDRGRLMEYDRATRTSRELLPRWDRSADVYAYSRSGDAIFIETTDASRHKFFRIARTGDGWSASPQAIVTTGNNSALSLSRDGRRLAWTSDAANRPAEVFVANVGPGGLIGQPRQLTRENASLLSELRMHPAEEYWFRGAGGDSVQGMIVRPPNWEAGKKFPVILLIHGGPQGAWLDQWHSRWNYQMFAAPGFGLVIINPRGSTGYGQKFVDDVSRDWAGKVWIDLMNGLDAALARNPWMDSTRMGAAGGSYGGYMVNWIAGHSTRFKALFTHAGVFNLENMYGATEELWFPDWEYGGPYWQGDLLETQYRRWSPHLSAGKFRTPHLVIHGELDYRVPYYEGVALFSALQRQNVPSRLVMYPDEGHWILKPQNQRLWWSEVQGWFARYLR